MARRTNVERPPSHDHGLPRKAKPATKTFWGYIVFPNRDSHSRADCRLTKSDEDRGWTVT